MNAPDDPRRAEAVELYMSAPAHLKPVLLAGFELVAAQFTGEQRPGANEQNRATLRKALDQAREQGNNVLADVLTSWLAVHDRESLARVFGIEEAEASPPA